MRGSCLCGEVVFDADPPLRDVIACHCTQCRKVSGHFWAATSVTHDRFRLVTDRGLRWFRSSGAARRGFCAGCGAALFWQPEGEARISIAAGAFDAPIGVITRSHIFTEDAGDYYAPEGPPPAVQAAGTLAGSCLCGSNRFTLPGPAGQVWSCHCTQCRKTSGHFSASFAADERALVWQARKDETHLTAAGSARGFCTDCGASLWFRSPDGDFSVEAGTIDGPTGGQLCAHIFGDERGDYYRIDDRLPIFPGHAPG
jgi:hypothetical protein